MKNIFYLISLLTIITFGNSCTDDFDDLNTDPKNLTTDALDASSYGLVAASAFYAPVYLGNRARGPFQLSHSLFSDVYANYFATTAPNFPSDRYVLVGRWLNGAYSFFYGTAAPQIKYAEDFAADNGFMLENAMVKVWRVYSYHRITDFWGPIPYKNFGNGETSVPYNSQEEIYNDFFTSLDEAVAVLKSNAGQTSSILGSNDKVFAGDANKWLKLANTLRLRLALRVRYVEPALAKAQAEKAIQDGVMENNEENAFVATDPNFRNPYNTITQWSEFRMSGDMESMLKGYKDPRVTAYFAEATEPDATDDPDGVSFNYEGFRNGQTKSQRQAVAYNKVASDMAGPYTVSGGAGPSFPVMRTAEAYFLRAEGALVGWNMGGGTAQEYYEAGIAASLAENGVGATDLAGADYVSSTSVPAGVDADNPAVSTAQIAYNPGGDMEQQLEQIITQKWIGLYPDSEEAWAERRRTGYPTLYDRVGSDNLDIAANEVPRRVPYVSQEYDTNREAVEAAVSSFLGGPDNGATKLWWDAK